MCTGEQLLWSFLPLWDICVGARIPEIAASSLLLLQEKHRDFKRMKQFNFSILFLFLQPGPLRQALSLELYFSYKSSIRVS